MSEYMDLEGAIAAFREGKKVRTVGTSYHYDDFHDMCRVLNSYEMMNGEFEVVEDSLTIAQLHDWVKDLWRAADNACSSSCDDISYLQGRRAAYAHVLNVISARKLTHGQW